MIVYPSFDKIAFEIGPFFGHGPLKVHWYGIMYLIAFAAGWFLARLRAKKPGSTWKPVDVDDFLFFCMLGTILGGRLGYVLFYKPGYYAAHPLEIFAIWQGGMSFHGGLLGVIVAMWAHARRQAVEFLRLTDFVAPLCPLGLAAGLSSPS